MNSLLRLILLSLSLALISMTTACSTVNKVKEKTFSAVEKVGTKVGELGHKVGEKTNIGQNPDDFFEGINRPIFSMNEKIDENILKPLASGYKNNTPALLQTAISNFFNNAGDLWTTVNHLLQGEFGKGANSFMRFSVNTVLGLGGFIDIMGASGAPRTKADFGQTLGVWGVPSGPYLVLPILGGSTLRDTAALPIDTGGDILLSETRGATKITVTGLRVIEKRASLLDASNLLDDIAVDKYTFVRGAYLQRRQSLIQRVWEDKEDANLTEEQKQEQLQQRKEIEDFRRQYE